MVPLALSFGINGITNGTIGRTLNDIGIPLIGTISRTLNIGNLQWQYTLALSMLPLIPMVSQWYDWPPMVPLVKLPEVPLEEPRTEPVCAKLPTLESQMIQYGVLNFRFINFKNYKDCFTRMILANNRNTKICT